MGPHDTHYSRETETPADLPFRLNKISHVVLKVADLERSLKFYTETLGLRVTDDYIATDTGCVWGGMLTAVRLADRAVFQEPCARGELVTPGPPID